MTERTPTIKEIMDASGVSESSACKRRRLYMAGKVPLDWVFRPPMQGVRYDSQNKRWGGLTNIDRSARLCAIPGPTEWERKHMRRLP